MMGGDSSDSAMSPGPPVPVYSNNWHVGAVRRGCDEVLPFARLFSRLMGRLFQLVYYA